MISLAQILFSSSHNPYYNLAVEEALLLHAQPQQVFLFIYQNQKSVMIGRNQNPWQESAPASLQKDGVILARRISGGGAVYHDLGNVNFALIQPKVNFCPETQTQRVLQAVKSVGVVESVAGPRHALFAGGKKFSGSAFCIKKESALHHGTLLVCTDLQDLSRYLSGCDDIVSKAVPSVRSPVVNLSHFVPGLTVQQMQNALVEAFQEQYGKLTRVMPVEAFLPKEQIASLCEKQASWAWRFGSTLPFDISLNKQFAWGACQLHMQVQAGKIVHVKVFSQQDVLKNVLPNRLQNCIFSAGDMVAALKSESSVEIADITQWIGGLFSLPTTI